MIRHRRSETDPRQPETPAHTEDQPPDRDRMTARTIVSDGVDELQRALADDAGFESWYRRSLPRVYAYLMSRGGGDVALAEDLTQQTFVAAIDQRSRFDGRSDTITWLCGIARHKLADHFRRARARGAAPDADGGPPDPSSTARGERSSGSRTGRRSPRPCARCRRASAPCSRSWCSTTCPSPRPRG